MTNARSIDTTKKRFMKKNGVIYECERQVKHHSGGQYRFWRCGCCKRGKMQSWDSECAVCHATVVPQ